MATYTHGHHASVLRSHQWRTAENSAGYLLAHLRPGQRVLDVGCGPGTITVDLAQRVAPGLVTGLDAAPGIVAQATALAADRTVSTVDFMVGDVHALPFDAGTFDVVHAHQVLQHLGDPLDALRELRRVCRPDGVVAVRDSDYAAFAWWPLNPVLDEWLSLYRRVVRRNGGDPDIGRRLLGLAQRAGFSQVAPTASVWCFATPDDRAWWGGLWSERVLASPFADTAVDSGLSTKDDLVRMAEAWLAWSAAPDGWFLVPHGEILAHP